MKRYGNLYSKVYDMDNIQKAHAAASKGKAHYREVKRIERNPLPYFTKIHNQLKAKTYRTSQYSIFTHYTGRKYREIYKLPYFPDRIVHHCIMQVVDPIWHKTLIAGTYSCIKGRGIHRAVDKLKNDLRDTVGTCYCLKCDVRKFYPSLDHEILKKILRKKIKDFDLLWLLDEIIDSAPGVPIGNYLSQHFGNLYLSEADHWIKEVAGCRYYYRYCDDLVFLHQDKSYLHDLRHRLEDFLSTKLNLHLKPNWQVFPVAARGVDFLGYRFFPDYVLLRKSIARKILRKAQKIKKYWQRLDPVHVLSCLMSYYGWMQHANCLHLIQSVFDREMLCIVRALCRKYDLKNPVRKIPELSYEAFF